ncbi:hypothetical protein BO83DRAFT_392508 [Aspergillus eucalypticola CBS 122712]|uniref:Uncharacterized protein n=1 Tax=Aspergillus eucalypticola (strain CBS 122712 / IBT 29274) TaxID=1448314 RepID=A0A317UVS6_ASPEC|nr:uncharacterized protein BO83DRAFT_392508 [Aspergillus eucalypticola CBS 122712]PWY64572.1 hypothetical protein BO83DRAFT_392508 [Aspergillus eucalypticola CBS 122712]
MQEKPAYLPSMKGEKADAKIHLVTVSLQSQRSSSRVAFLISFEKYVGVELENPSAFGYPPNPEQLKRSWAYTFSCFDYVSRVSLGYPGPITVGVKAMPSSLDLTRYGQDRLARGMPIANWGLGSGGLLESLLLEEIYSKDGHLHPFYFHRMSPIMNNVIWWKILRSVVFRLNHNSEKADDAISV